LFFSTQADRAAYPGQLRKADELSRRAVASAQHAGQKETAEAYDTAAALRQAIFGHPADARKRATAALNVSKGLDVEYQAALALALTGDTAQVQALATDLNKQFPQDTIVQSKKIPTLNAQLGLNRNEPLKAIEALQPAIPYVLGIMGTNTGLYPVYVRGQAYLAAREGSQAAGEFQKIIDHRSLGLNPLGSRPSRSRPRLRLGGRHGQSQSGIPEFPHPLERRRSRHPDPEGSQVGMRKVAVAEDRMNPANRSLFRSLM